jgi:hypothetical protein
MRKITLFSAVIFIVAITVGVSAQTAKEKLNAKSAINKEIKKSEKTRDAEEEPPYEIVFGDLDGDGDTDVVVLYNLVGFGGGMDWDQTLAVFLNKKGVFSFIDRKIVGGKYEWRGVKLINIKNGLIGLDEGSCGIQNPNLCENPKVKRIYFSLKNNKLKEGK